MLSEQEIKDEKSLLGTSYEDKEFLRKVSSWLNFIFVIIIEKQL